MRDSCCATAAGAQQGPEIQDDVQNSFAVRRETSKKQLVQVRHDEGVAIEHASCPYCRTSHEALAVIRSMASRWSDEDTSLHA
jgi:hypothetical protein